ncbi:efflux transporter outer membrane subunit [Sphingomonas endophytica]|uniref:NodT family efflux transporter outer membrane factor (OMF) lipoprotein n=1 Tax=Sphingomonas endophytica TaxID=869719 RepID=A0ABR6N1I3_9SPHN|nr:efflux transporter outer membrane subunit [Sphingomonas endophytica]MBB5724650.1 NodT family efflux transporter outer membrane factor (OMF) lipoprotein [Sphingomonas endophytica]
MPLTPPVHRAAPPPRALCSLARARAGLAAAVALLFAGCAAPASHTSVEAKTPTALALAGPSVQLAPDWWHAIGDPQLDRLVADALAGNPSLDVAAARVRQAQAALERQDAERRPSIDADAQVQGTRLSGNYTIPPPYAGTVRALGTAQAGLSWNLDLFGRQKAAIEVAAAQTRAAGYDVAAARLMLAGAVVQNYVEVARAERRAAIAARTIKAREGSLSLVQARERSQLASRIDVTAAGTLLAQARLALVQAQAARVLATNALAALAGRGSDYAATIGATQLATDTALPVPTAIPADLLARRADIAAAQARIAAAGAERQVARRAFYPNINLSALVGLQAIGFGNFVDLDSGTAGGGAAFHLPLFDSGRRRADLAGATAALDVATAQYNDAVVTAARQVADAIAQVRATDTARLSQSQVTAGFAETNRLNTIRVASGLNSRLDLVDNDVRLLDAELADASLSIDALAARAQLATALGGGFDPVQDAAR